MTTLEETLKRHFGHASFLAGQRQIIELVLSGRDALILMPTGGGKSLTYQLPALHLSGLTVVVSPLIALMQDQVERLHTNGIAATFMNSMLGADELERRGRAMLAGKIKLLYLAPERLLTGSMLQLLDQVHEYFGISLLAIDEAHCVSEWGHDFRPEYRQLHRLREHYTQVPVLALTATATERVRQDIIAQLRLHDPYVHIASFNRPNLYYEVRQKHKGSFHELVTLLRRHPEDSTIIYCQSRKGVDALSADLSVSGIRNLPYHAGLSDEERRTHQERFIRDDVPVLVATVAFGMGIAKPDVRAVVHYDMPKSLEGYYQESGRAGRDGERAQCIFFFQRGDRVKLEYIIGQKIDEQEQRLARQQMQQVMAYAESTVCRRRVLLAYFGEQPASENCGNCDTCLTSVTMEDRTIDAQKFLSCVARTQQRFGMRHIIEVLRGANTQKIRALQHDQLSTYGIGKELSIDEWLYLGRALLHQGLLSETNDGYPILRLNQLSAEILKRQRRVEVPAQRVIETVPELPSIEERQQATADSQALFAHLRLLRKQLADERGVPPYVIFTDTSLQAMAQQRPQTEEQFVLIPGVGENKLAAYFASFTAAIRAYCLEHQLPMGLISPERTKAQRRNANPAQKQSALPSTRQATLELYRQGYGIEQIAEERGLRSSTVVNHLAELIESGESLDVEHLIAPNRYTIIAQALHDLGDEYLKPAKDQLGDEYSYEELRLVRAMLRRPQ